MNILHVISGTRRHSGRALSCCAVAGALMLVCAATAFAQPSPPVMVPPPGKAATDRVPILREVGIDQKLDQQIPLGLTFTDENGQDVHLSEYFKTRPVILALVYYEC